ncbi:amidohydrolase [Leucobacter rhizosphaerae]|uniref:Amidohydrolase n=1 Tax=Leucobacter rhizosphaerae TaxID=2932245 RepID=A0ABY4FU10_9MICO|nr:amidohydrolase [Leucobacter rhizosphaerae]UOQ59737.1 amidohydrolase [Leucobacter rhizosphaerae]
MQHPPSEHTPREDTVFRNAVVHTQDPGMPAARSVRVSGGRITEVSTGEVRTGGARVIDLEGATLVPGFNDVHAHSIWFGLSKLELDLSTAATLAELYDAVADRAGRAAPGEWIVASGFSHIRLGGQYPDRDALDRAAGGRPVWLKHNSGHFAFVNGAALQLIEARADLSAPIEGGVVTVDSAGRPTGLLEENAMSLVQDLVLPYPTATIADALDLATQHYLREGITSVTDAGIAGGWIGNSPREFAAYQIARAEGRLHTRMQPMFIIDALHAIPGHETDHDILTLDGGIHTGFGDDWLQLGPVKIFSDGSLLGSTASLSEHYFGCPDNHGYLQESPETLRSRALRAYAGGWSIAMHAIGDHAVDQAISIIGEAQRRFGRRAIPNRIEHAGIVRDDQLPLLAELGIAVTPQPFFLREFGDAMVEKIGAERVGQLYRGRSFLDAGIMLPGSSDRPVADGNVLAGIQSFVERRTGSGAIVAADERLSAAQALAAYTVGSASATGQAHNRGTIRPGMLADLVVLGDDPLTVPSARIADIDLLATVIDGRIAVGAERLGG